MRTAGAFRSRSSTTTASSTNFPSQRKQQLAGYRLLRGSLDGAPGSWVRLTESARGVEGAIWDGHDLYTVTRYENIAPLVTTPIDAAPGQTVVYRLSDSRDLLPRGFCGLADDAVMAKAANGLEQYEARRAARSKRGVYSTRAHAPDRDLADRRHRLPGCRIGRSDRRDAGAAQHRRRHFQ